MVDAERLTAILSRVTARLRILADYATSDPIALRADRVRMGDLKYTFQTAIEACIDAAQHVVADQGLSVPATNADAFRIMSAAGLLDARVAASMAAACGFRNVLVHGYAEVDDGKVIAHLQHLAEIRAFVAATAKLIDGH